MNNLSCLFSLFLLRRRSRKKKTLKEHHSENVLGLGSQGMCSLDEQEQGLRSMQLGINPDDVEPILRKRQYVLQVRLS
jgi:hypothetical protein